MTRKEQNKILDDKIESNVNQYKVDRLNAEISAFSSSDLNKYEFLTRKYLNYKPNALDKARFEFSPLGHTFSIGLDKTAQGYQEEGVIKLLKDIRDGLVRAPLGPRGPGGPGGPRAPPGSGPDSDNDDNMPDLETEEEAAERKADSYEQKKYNKYAIKNKNLTSAEKNELQNKIKELETQKNSINNKFRCTINVIKSKKNLKNLKKL